MCLTYHSDDSSYKIVGRGPIKCTVVLGAVGTFCYVSRVNTTATTPIRARIAAVGAYVPPRRMTNVDLSRIVDTSDEWISSHTGIRNRHIAEDDQAASDLALPASRQALERAGLNPEDIDLILVATSTPDYPGLPSTASVLQHKLEVPAAGAMDVVAACSGFIYALETARTYVVAGAARHVLVAGTEVYSRIVDWTDRSSCVLFGDGAGAVIVSASDNPDDPGEILPAILGSRGAGAEALYRSHGGTRNPYVPGQTRESDLKLKMDGRKVYNFAVAIVGQVISELLDRQGLRFQMLDWVVPHQANIRIIEAVAKRNGWDVERFYRNISEYANTSAASIPIALNEMVEKEILKRGMRILTVGFGAGLSWGGHLISW